MWDAIWTGIKWSQPMYWMYAFSSSLTGRAAINSFLTQTGLYTFFDWIIDAMWDLLPTAVQTAYTAFLEEITGGTVHGIVRFVGFFLSQAAPMPVWYGCISALVLSIPIFVTLRIILWVWHEFPSIFGFSGGSGS